MRCHLCAIAPCATGFALAPQKSSIIVTQPMRISLGDQVRLRKRHPCGGDVWEVVRTGMDIRIKCLTCGGSVLLPRSQFEKQVKEFVKTASPLG